MSRGFTNMPPPEPINEPISSLLTLGAIYRDVILKVPKFPAEDSKLRATSERTRVGGNVPNSLSVLSQVLPKDFSVVFVSVVGGVESSWRCLCSTHRLP